MPPAAAHPASPIILPVGGGKGGIGKSSVAANLALALARLDHPVTVVDADLGGSDLHILLGLDNDRPGLGEVLTSRELTLDQVVYPVLEPRLFFVPGDAMMVATANPSFQKKRKTLHALRSLPGQFALLDLGSGTAITVMDFYLTSPLSLVVMLPERPAVLNTFNFLRNAVFRALERIFRDNSRTKKLLQEFQARSRGPGQSRLRQLAAALEDAAPGQGARAQRAVARWRPKLILNRVRRVEDFVYARQLERWATEDLGLNLEVLGFIPEDDLAREAAAGGHPALDLDPRSPFARAIALLALKITPWAGRGHQWATQTEFTQSFERAATDFARLFPPPGTPLLTRQELLNRLKELEKKS
ncbi:MAG: P-loop NTPase [Deltaproteobacteria bacterium]|nr:P-loop NTPase [Deltaproteobacteria bacterium]